MRFGSLGYGMAAKFWMGKARTGKIRLVVLWQIRHGAVSPVQLVCGTPGFVLVRQICLGMGGYAMAW